MKQKNGRRLFLWSICTFFLLLFVPPFLPDSWRKLVESLFFNSELVLICLMAALLVTAWIGHRAGKPYVIQPPLPAASHRFLNLLGIPCGLFINIITQIPEGTTSTTPVGITFDILIGTAIFCMFWRIFMKFVIQRESKYPSI